MGFWPWRRRIRTTKVLELLSPDGLGSDYLEEALAEAAERPLDDMVWRLVIASPRRHIITDVGLVTMDTACQQHEKQTDPAYRTAAAEGLARVFDSNLTLDRETFEVLRFVALAFFDREFTRGANKGKTHETAWNTLALEVEPLPDRVRISRRAVRIEYPVGRIDLNFPFNPFGGAFH